jgi:hypothetical protein
MPDSSTSLLQHDWFVGFLSGVVATLIGFGLTILWDIFKMRRETREREGRVLRALSEELSENRLIVAEDLKMVRHEIAVLAEEKTLVQPLALLKTGFWDVAKVNLPKALLQGDRLLRLRAIAAQAESCNEQIRSRENHRVHNGAMSNFASRLKLYDEALERTLMALQGTLDDYDKATVPGPG